MKRLIALTILGLALGYPSLAFALDYMSLYTQPTNKSSVGNELKSGNVESDFMSFYVTPKSLYPVSSSRTSNEKADDTHITVFGVQIASESGF